MADTQLEKLYVAIDATTANFNKQIAGVNSKITGLQATTNKASASMSTAFAKLGTAVAAAFSVAALVMFTKNMINTADSLKTMAAQTGLSVTRIQELRYAVTQTGGNMDMLKRSIQTISDAIVSGNPALKQLGITTTNAGEAFDQVILKLADMGDTAERNVLGQELLGRSFVELKPLLAQGADGINTLTQAARTSGLVMSEGLVNRLDDLGDSLATLKLQIIAAFYPIVSFVLPALQALVNALSYTIGFITGVIQAIFGMAQAAGSTTKPIDNVTDSNNNLAKSAAAVKRAYAGFDELNVIPAATSAASPNIPSIDTGGVGKEAAKALEDAAKAAAKFNAAIQSGLEFWDKWGGVIVFILGLLAALWAANVIGSKLTMSLIDTIAIMAIDIANGFDRWFLKLFSTGEALTGLGEILFNIATWLQGLAASMGIAISTTAALMVVVAAIIAIIVAFGIAIVDLWKNNEEFRNKVIGFWNDIVNTFVNAYNQYLKPVFDMLGAMFVILYEDVILPFYEQVKIFVDKLVDALIGIWTAIKPVIDVMMVVLGVVVAAIGGAIAIIIAVFFTLLNVVMTVINGVMDILIWLINQITINFIQPFTLAFKGIIKFFEGTFTGDLDKAVQGLADIFNGVVQLVVWPFKEAFNWVVDIWNNTIGKLSWTVPDWVPIIGGTKISAPKLTKFTSIPKFANGGMPDAGSLFVAGEAGAELVGSHQGRTTVMPLENTNFVAAMKQAMFEGLTEAMGSDGNRNIILQVGELELGRAAVKGMNKISLVDGTLGLNY